MLLGWGPQNMSFVSTQTPYAPNAFELPVWAGFTKDGLIYRSVDGVLSFFGFGLPRQSESAQINLERSKRLHLAQTLRGDLQAEMQQIVPLKPLVSKRAA